MLKVQRRTPQRIRARTPSSSRWPAVSRRWRSPVAGIALALMAGIGICAEGVAQGIQATPLPAKTAGLSSAPDVGANEASSKHRGNSAHTPIAEPRPASPAASPEMMGTGPGAPTIDRPTVISYLGELISWYRHLQVEERLATEPAETLYVADNRQNANRILNLGFQYADAAAKFLNVTNPAPTTAPPTNSASNVPGDSAASVSRLLEHRANAQSAAAAANANVQRLKDALSRARPRQRDVIAHQLAGSARGCGRVGDSRSSRGSGRADAKVTRPAGHHRTD
jgi:hypothetical protein